MSTKNQEVQQLQPDTQAEPLVHPEERHRMIAEAAYFIAERQGFDGDCESHWLEAEREIDRALSAAAASSVIPD